MVNEYEIRNLTKNFIEMFQINSGEFESLRPKIQEQLLQVEAYFQDFIQEQKVMAIRIKNNKLNLVKVVRESGLQRSTVYNNADTLKKYIEERIYDVEKEDILSIQKNVRQEEDMFFLRSYLEKLQLQIVEDEVNEIKIEELEYEYSKLNDVNIDLLRQIFELKQENQELQQQLRKIKSKDVVPLIKEEE
ncbi:TPA: hypothetical protein ACHIRZ_004465 [Bacillus paranthracis]